MGPIVSKFPSYGNGSLTRDLNNRTPKVLDNNIKPKRKMEFHGKNKTENVVCRSIMVLVTVEREY